MVVGSRRNIQKMIDELIHTRRSRRIQRMMGESSLLNRRLSCYRYAHGNWHGFFAWKICQVVLYRRIRYPRLSYYNTSSTVRLYPMMQNPGSCHIKNECSKQHVCSISIEASWGFQLVWQGQWIVRMNGCSRRPSVFSCYGGFGSPPWFAPWNKRISSYFGKKGVLSPRITTSKHQNYGSKQVVKQ